MIVAEIRNRKKKNGRNLITYYILTTYILNITHKIRKIAHLWSMPMTKKKGNACSSLSLKLLCAIFVDQSECSFQQFLNKHMTVRLYRFPLQAVVGNKIYIIRLDWSQASKYYWTWSKKLRQANLSTKSK